MTPYSYKVMQVGQYELKPQWPPHNGGVLYVKWLGVEPRLTGPLQPASLLIHITYDQ